MTEKEALNPKQMFDTAADDPDFLRCMQYLEIRERTNPRPTMLETANRMHVSLRSIHYWVQRWENSGLLRRCRQTFILPRLEEVQLAESVVIDDWPQVIDRVLTIAKKSKSDKVAVEAADWLYQNIVKPVREAKTSDGSEELIYLQALADAEGALDPMNINSGSISAEPDTGMHVESSMPVGDWVGIIPAQSHRGYNESIETQEGGDAGFDRSDD